MTTNCPNTSTLGTSTPSWAAIVIANGVASGPNPASRRRNGGPTTVTPAVAPTDSQKPTERTSSGSTSNKMTTAVASNRGGSRSVPMAKASAARAAIVPARSTDGSARVSTTNQPIRAIVATRRKRGPGALEQRGGDRQGQGDVLPGNRREVGQATLAEAGGHRFGLVGVVADDQSTGEGGVVAAERGGAAAISARTRFDATSNRRPATSVAEHVVVEPADDVLPGDPAGTLRIERATSAGDPHTVALLPRLDAQSGRPAAHPQFEALVVDPQQHTCRVERRVRVGGDRRPADVLAQLDREPARRARQPSAPITTRAIGGDSDTDSPPPRSPRPWLPARTTISAGARRQALNATTAATRTATPGSPAANHRRHLAIDAPAAGDHPPLGAAGNVDSVDVLVAPPEQASLPQSPMTDPVYEGPLWYRSRIRQLRADSRPRRRPPCWDWWPWPCWQLFDGRASGWTGLILGVCAAPGLLAIGVPFASTSMYPIGIGISVVLWFFVGVIASRIATRNPMASFADFWRAYRWLAIGVWVGVLAALAGSSLILGRELL